MPTRDEILASYPILDAMRDYGVELSGGGDERKGKCPFHKDGNPSFCVNPEKGTWICYAGCGGGSVIDFIALKEGKPTSQVFSEMAQKAQSCQFNPPPAHSGKKEIDKIYQYHTALGEDAFQVVRLKPKDFRQRHLVAGRWVWKMDGVERVLYRLPEVLRSETVWVVEGEKDADNLAALGFTATCNVGGAGKWLDGYTDSLSGKDIVICGDNDGPGQAHVKMVFDSIAGRVAQARIVKIPAGHHDVSDFIGAHRSPEDAGSALRQLYNAAQAFTKGVHVPVFTLAELEGRYAEYAQSLDKNQLNLGKWLPSLGRHVRGLVPGELITIIADTGAGKTAILQNICMKSAPLKTILFELELPSPLMFERFVAINTGFHCSQVEDGYRTGDRLGPDALGRIAHLYICTEARLTPIKLEEYINKAELKMGERPRVVAVDYIGLMQGSGRSRYERVSNAAEDMKVVAKSTDTIMIMASQISRKQDDEDGEIFLHDAKDSGSIEASSGLLLGAWRDKKDPGLLNLKILKNTKGRAGVIIPCNFNGENMRITERSPIHPEDIPPRVSPQ